MAWHIYSITRPSPAVHSLLSDPGPSLPLKVLPGDCFLRVEPRARPGTPDTVTRQWVAVACPTAARILLSLAHAEFEQGGDLSDGFDTWAIYHEPARTSESRPAASRFRVITGGRPPVYRITGHYHFCGWPGACAGPDVPTERSC
jgi:hypothetical protein